MIHIDGPSNMEQGTSYVDWATDLKSILTDGLYVRNLEKIIRLTEKPLKQGIHILPAYTIQSVASDLFYHWDERAVTSDETHKAEHILLPAFDLLLTAVINNDSPDNVVSLTESLIRAAIMFFYSGSVFDAQT